MPTEIDPSDRLSEGWEPAPLPARTPNDPMPSSPRLPVLSLPAPTLCEQGPCAHYHKAVLRFDAATPMDGSQDVTHVQNLRSCYPTAGISIELEDSPVFECSRWSPLDLAFKARLERLRSDFMESAEGAQYAGELAAWRADQQRIRDEIAKYSETPHPELGEIEAMLLEMTAGDTLELRRKGEQSRLDTVTCAVAPLELAVVPSFAADALLERFGAGDYQLRIVNARGAIVSTRIITIAAPQTTETPTP